MLYVVHIFSRHSFLLGVAVCLPLLIFFYFGHVKLVPFWIQPRVLSEAAIFGITDNGWDRRVFLSAGVRSTDAELDPKENVTFDTLKSRLYRSFIDNGLQLKPIVFDPAVDVLVLLHIQKTGGSSFGRLLALDILNLTCARLESGRKQHDCSVPVEEHSHESAHSIEEPLKVEFSDKATYFDANAERRAIWMFSRFSVGWACGLHADWTELKSCVEKVLTARESFNRTRRYHFITILREPVSRYISEWRHIARGATWAGAELRCNGRQASLAEVPFCYEGNNWRGVSLSEFLSCDHNLANNRQTRMLADLSKVNCYNRTGMNPLVRSEKMLRSALENLASFSFFGLSEHQHLTQWLFEHSFTNLRFRVNLTQKETKAERFMPTLTAMDLHQVRRINSLDVLLYDFARSLFFERIAAYSKQSGAPVPFQSSSSFEFEDGDNDY